MADDDARRRDPAPAAESQRPKAGEPKGETEAHRAGVEAVARALNQPD